MTADPTPSAPLRSVLLAGGGTAGHVYPLLALADTLRDRHPGLGVHVLGTAEGLESRLVPERGYPLHTVPKVAFPRRLNAAAARFPAAFAGMIRRTQEIVEQVQPQVIVGFGSYVATPAYVVAKRRGLPIVVHEQNAHPGLGNKLGSRWTRHVATTFPSTVLPNATCIGMPLRREMRELDRAALRATARDRWNLDPDRPVVLVTGGSLGAQRLNVAFERSVRTLARAGVQVLHVTGQGKEFTPVDTSDLGSDVAPYVVVPYVDAMHEAFAACDLVVTRSGAGMVSEITAVGLPAVYVPLPIGNGEQRYNPEDVVRAEGGILVEDAEVTPQWVQDVVVPLATDPDRLARMAAASAAQGHRDADQALAAMVERAAHEGAGA